MLSVIKTIYEEYFVSADKISGKVKVLGGFLGIGKRPGDDICHEEFSERLKSALSDACEKCTSEELRGILSYIYETPVKQKARSDIYWMLLGVHAHTLDAVPKLMPEDAKLLAAEYERCYPSRKRLPVQDKLYKALKERAADGKE